MSSMDGKKKSTKIVCNCKETTHLKKNGWRPEGERGILCRSPSQEDKLNLGDKRGGKYIPSTCTIPLFVMSSPPSYIRCHYSGEGRNKRAGYCGKIFGKRSVEGSSLKILDILEQDRVE